MSYIFSCSPWSSIHSICIRLLLNTLVRVNAYVQTKLLKSYLACSDARLFLLDRYRESRLNSELEDVVAILDGFLNIQVPRLSNP